MSIRILLIEDNPDHIQITKRVLEKDNTNYQLELVSDPREGISRIFMDNYDLILSDYRLPGLNALDILKGLKQKGKDIPLEARILAITDAFVAMISQRPYAEALSEEEALEEMKRGAGTQFDPELVKVFLSIVKTVPSLPEGKNMRR